MRGKEGLIIAGAAIITGIVVDRFFKAPQEDKSEIRRAPHAFEPASDLGSFAQDSIDSGEFVPNKLSPIEQILHDRESTSASGSNLVYGKWKRLNPTQQILDDLRRSSSSG